MSDYPPAPSYGPSYGARDQTDPTYLPSTYPNQYLQGEDGHTGHMGANYDASMAAYAYNRGIPTFSAAAVASGVPPLPIYQGWNDAIPLPTYTAPHNSSQYNGYGSGSQANAQYYQPMGQSNYHQSTGVKTFEQTDLSEGEFEDNGASTNTPPAGYGSNNYQGNYGTGYMDTAQRAVYSQAQDYSPQSSYQANSNYNYPSNNPSQTGRQQSNSYSPYISPQDRDDQSEGIQKQSTYPSNHVPDPINGRPQSQYGWAQNGSANQSQQNSYANGYHTSQRVDSSIQVPAASQPAVGQLPSSANGKSVLESRKKAQGAILNLLPYDVRYQTYIDEGFKEDIVGKLFDDLKMPRTSTKALNGTHAISGSPNYRETKSQSSYQEHLTPSASGNQSLAGSRNDTQHAASSLSMGINTQQTAVKSPGMPQASLSPSISTAATSAPVKSTTMTEKERTLQTKMEALRKSREERAQKAAAKTITNLSAAPVPVPQVELLEVAETSEKRNSPLKSPTIPKAQPKNSDQPTLSQTQRQPVNMQPQQQPPIIPGLFLASAVASPAPPPLPQGALQAPVQINQRKRPVAADFDDFPPSSTAFKRPFGYTPHNGGRPSLVIDLSDDEEEDVAMDLDSQADQDSPVQSIRKMSDLRSTAVQNIPPANPPTRKPFTPPNTSSTNTPLVPPTMLKASLGRPDVLLRKESEIEELKKKIAEAEARKRARQTPSGTRTPRASESNNSDVKDPNIPDDNLGSQVAASIKMQNLIGIADDKVALEQQKLADAQDAEIEKAAELKRVEAEQRRMRRERIASDLPLVEAEVLQNQTRLEQLRAEMAKIEAAVQKNLEDKRKLAEEMERLGQEAEDQLQAQKDKLKTLTRQVSRSNGEPSGPASLTAVELSLPSRSLENHDEPVRPDSNETPTLVTTETDPKSPVLNGNLSYTINVDDNQPSANKPLPQSTEETKNHPKESLLIDQTLEAALQEAVRAEADSHSRDGNEVDIEVSYAPNPTQLAPEMASETVEENRSPEYSPVPHRTVPDVPDRESDDYEPPDATAPSEVLESPPFSPAPPDSIKETANGVVQDTNPINPINENRQNIAEEPQTLDRHSKQPLENGPKEDLNRVQLFTPYESPLKQFRAYRFHPEYKQDIPGGLRSMTYSHKIDPNTELCRFELAGGICNDAACDLQHFRDLKLPDDAVLTALGSPDEFTGEQREKFCEGLRQVLMDLRVRKIRDFDIIASEIVAHRAQFLGDKSKVLALEGTAI